MKIEVACYAGHWGEETPRWIAIGGHRLEVAAVLDRWLAPDHRYFKLRTHDGGIWIVRHDVRTSEWRLTFFRQD